MELREVDNVCVSFKSFNINSPYLGDTLIRRSGHYNAWKVSTWSLPVRIEMPAAYE